jgi:hypothetical protein
MKKPIGNTSGLFQILFDPTNGIQPPKNTDIRRENQDFLKENRFTLLV